jgi:hypothetical protein
MSAPAAKSKPKPAVKAGATAKRFNAKSKVAGTTGKKPPAKRGATAGAKSSTQSRASSGYPTQIPRSIYQSMSTQAFNPFNPWIKRWHNGVLPIPNSLGHYNYVHSFHELALSPPLLPQNITYVILLWNASSAYAFQFKDNADCVERRMQILHVSKPAFVRPGRCGLRILNTTKADNVEGRVSVFETMQPLQLKHILDSGSVDNQTLTNLGSLMANSATTRKYSAQECTRGVEAFLRPASHAAFPEWHAYQNLDDAGVNERGILTLGAMSQACSVVVVGFHGCETQQTYHIEVKAETFCRYAADSIMSTQVVAPPPTHASNGMADAASKEIPFG